MHNADRVCCFEARSDLKGDFDSKLKLEGAGFYKSVERRPTEKLHDDEGDIVPAPPIIDNDDVGVLELREELGFVVKSVTASGPGAVVFGLFCEDDLDGDSAIEREIFSAEDDPLTTFAEHFFKEEAIITSDVAANFRDRASGWRCGESVQEGIERAVVGEVKW